MVLLLSIITVACAVLLSCEAFIRVLSDHCNNWCGLGEPMVAFYRWRNRGLSSRKPEGLSQNAQAPAHSWGASPVGHLERVGKGPVWGTSPSTNPTPFCTCKGLWLVLELGGQD